MNTFRSRIPFLETSRVVGLHGLCNKLAGKVMASSSCKFVADCSRTLMSCRIVVHLVQDKLLSLLWIERFHSFSATSEPKLLASLFYSPWSIKKRDHSIVSKLGGKNAQRPELTSYQCHGRPGVTWRLSDYP